MKKLIMMSLMMLIILAGCTRVKEEPLIDKNPTVTIKVKGYEETIELELYYDVAPNTVKNFIDLANNNYYDGTIFHRVIKNFMIQGGEGKSGLKAIKGEFSDNGFINDLKHVRGVISMARTSINDSATSQFFIMHEDNDYLDGKYAAFGMMLKGFATLDSIAEVETNFNDRPYVNIVIESIRIETYGVVFDKPLYV